MIGFKEAFDENRPALVLRDLTAKIFEPGGYLQAGLGLEHRREQEDMANNVAMALSDDCPLLFEAGTGTGKSLAYLIPSIIHAISRQRQGIISTHTISLQEQVNEKDLKLCRALFNEIPELEAYKDFRAAVLIGKGNYLCTTRLAKTVESPKELFQPELEKELERIFDWSQQTKTGIVHELDPVPHPEV